MLPSLPSPQPQHPAPSLPRDAPFGASAVSPMRLPQQQQSGGMQQRSKESCCPQTPP